MIMKRAKKAYGDPPAGYRTAHFRVGKRREEMALLLW